MEWLINDIEKDLFREIANIGLSKAADSLASIAKDRVLLSVPDIHMAKPNSLVQIITDDEDGEELFVVQSDIKGELEGKTLLLFSKVQADKFLSKTLETIGDYEGSEAALKKSLLLEISNIITGSIITQFANIFNIDIYSSVPKIPEHDLPKTIDQITKELSSFQPIVFTIKAKFLNGDKLSKLPLLVIFDTDTLLKLLSYVRSEHNKNFNMLYKRS